MNRQTYNNILIISGSGRNPGKTTLACNIISYFSRYKKIMAIKISPHQHEHQNDGKLLISENDFRIYEETGLNQKDSSLMLQAGAFKSLYINSDDESIVQAFEKVSGFVSLSMPIICESGSLSTYIKPGVFIFMQDPNHILTLEKAAYKEKTDKIILTGSEEIFKPETFLNLEGNFWQLTSIKS